MRVTSRVRFLYKVNCNLLAIGNNGEHFSTALGDHFKQSPCHKNITDCVLSRPPPQGCVRVWELAREGSTWPVSRQLGGWCACPSGQMFPQSAVSEKCLWVENTGVEKFSKSSKWQRQNQLIMGSTTFWPQVSMDSYHFIYPNCVGDEYDTGKQFCGVFWKQQLVTFLWDRFYLKLSDH